MAHLPLKSKSVINLSKKSYSIHDNPEPRKLLTRQLSKMEKLSYENEFNLNQPTLSPSDHEKSEPKFDPILEEVEHESESQEDHECQEYPRRRPSSNYSLHQHSRPFESFIFVSLPIKGVFWQIK